MCDQNEMPLLETNVKCQDERLNCSFCMAALHFVKELANIHTL